MSIKNERGAGDSTTTFVKKLYGMLEDAQHPDIVSWSWSGDSFIVHDAAEFTRLVLPQLFNHSNFASFVRQLNKYDFHKLRNKDSNSQNENEWKFAHESFARGKPELLEIIRRKAVPKDRKDPSTQSLEERISSLEEQNRLLGMNVANLQQQLVDQGKTIQHILGLLRASPPQLKHRTSSGSSAGSPDTQHPLPSPKQMRGATMNVVAGSMAHANTVSDINSQPFQPVNGGNGVATVLPSVVPNVASGVPNGVASGVPSVVPGGVPSNVTVNGPAGVSVGSTDAQQAPHILLVDDDDVCLRIASKFLSNYGCQVTFVRDGVKALEAAQSRHFEIIFMDVIIPALDGITATQLIRKSDPNVAIIAMTGNTEKLTVEAYRERGMTDALFKPFNKDDMYRMLDHYLRPGSTVERYGDTQHLAPMVEDSSQKRQKVWRS